MAKNRSTVYLGYEDEEISAKHAAQLNSNVNKIGGEADWPSSAVKIPPCPLCGQIRPLIVQLYAPLEQSQFHRSLYVFACLHPLCSQNSKSWLCVRTQHLELISALHSPIANKPNNKKKAASKTAVAAQKIAWCSGTDDWGDDSLKEVEKMDTEPDDFTLSKEENGNVALEKLDYEVVNAKLVGDVAADIEDDDDDDSHSMENDLVCGFGHLDMHSAQNSDPNANCAAEVAAGIAKDKAGLCGATAVICAEIEGPNETDIVIVETPQKPERDLIALLKHTPNTAAWSSLSKLTDVTLKSYFMAVEIEQKNSNDSCDQYDGALSADHIRELYQEYKRQDEAALSPSSAASAAGAVGGAEEQETYERALPAHGDIIFHEFVSTLQQNPGQILRYSRNTLPLLIAPLNEPIPKCQNCDGDTICEIQILSTLIPKLKLQQNNEAAPIEYGNVLIFTCLKSCWDTPDKMRYERVVVQNEN